MSEDFIIVTVVAPESSGQYWLKSCLRQHPAIRVHGDSMPTGMLENRHYPDFGGAEHLIVLCRDRGCSERSVTRRAYNAGHEGSFTPDDTLNAMKATIARAKRVLFVSFEGLLFYRGTYFDHIFKWLGVPPFPIITSYEDANAKYFKS